MFSGSIEERQNALKKLIKSRFENLKLVTDRAMIHPGNPTWPLVASVELLYQELMNSTGRHHHEIAILHCSDYQKQK